MRNLYAFLHDFAYKWAGAWFAVVALVASFSYYQGRNTDQKFEALRGGICSLVAESNKAVPKNRGIYQGQINRAKVRLAYDLKHSTPTLAQADRDAIAANERALHRTHTFTLPGC